MIERTLYFLGKDGANIEVATNTDDLKHPVYLAVDDRAVVLERAEALELVETIIDILEDAGA